MTGAASLAIATKAALARFPEGKGILGAGDETLWTLVCILAYEAGGSVPPKMDEMGPLVSLKVAPLLGTPQGKALVQAAKEATRARTEAVISALVAALQAMAGSLGQVVGAKELGQLKGMLRDTWPKEWGAGSEMKIPPLSRVGSGGQFGPPAEAMPGYKPYDPGIGTAPIPSQKWQAYEPGGGWQKPEEVRDKIPKSTKEGLPVATQDYEAGKKDAQAGVPSREKSLDTGAIGDGIRMESYRLGYQAGLGLSKDPEVAQRALQKESPRELRKQLLAMTRELRGRQTYWIVNTSAGEIERYLSSGEAALQRGDREKTEAGQAREYARGIVEARKAVEYLNLNPGKSPLEVGVDAAGRVVGGAIDGAKKAIDGAQTTIIVAAVATGAVAVLGIIIWARGSGRRRR